MKPIFSPAIPSFTPGDPVFIFKGGERVTFPRLLVGHMTEGRLDCELGAFQVALAVLHSRKLLADIVTADTLKNPELINTILKIVKLIDQEKIFDIASDLTEEREHITWEEAAALNDTKTLKTLPYFRDTSDASYFYRDLVLCHHTNLRTARAGHPISKDLLESKLREIDPETMGPIRLEILKSDPAKKEFVERKLKDYADACETIFQRYKAENNPTLKKLIISPPYILDYYNLKPRGQAFQHPAYKNSSFYYLLEQATPSAFEDTIREDLKEIPLPPKILL